MDKLINTIKKLDLSIGIGEVSRLTGASDAQLRYWEKKGLVKTTRRQSRGNKRYDLNSLMRIILIKYYIDNGYTLSKASDEIKSRRNYGHAITTFIFKRLITIQKKGETITLHFGVFDNDPNNELIVKVNDKKVKMLCKKKKEN